MMLAVYSVMLLVALLSTGSAFAPLARNLVVSKSTSVSTTAYRPLAKAVAPLSATKKTDDKTKKEGEESQYWQGDWVRKNLSD